MGGRATGPLSIADRTYSREIMPAATAASSVPRSRLFHLRAAAYWPLVERRLAHHDHRPRRSRASRQRAGMPGDLTADQLHQQRARPLAIREIAEGVALAPPSSIDDTATTCRWDARRCLAAFAIVAIDHGANTMKKL